MAVLALNNNFGAGVSFAVSSVAQAGEMLVKALPNTALPNMQVLMRAKIVIFERKGIIL